MAPQLTIASVDRAPAKLHEQIPGDDRPDEWPGALESPLHWIVDDHLREVPQ